MRLLDICCIERSIRAYQRIKLVDEDLRVV